MGKKPLEMYPCDIMVPNKGMTDISIWGCTAGVSTFPPSNAHTYVTSQIVEKMSWATPYLRPFRQHSIHGRVLLQQALFVVLVQ